MPRLLDLPPELIALTARYLSVDGLRNCRLSCKDLRDKVARVFENACFKRRSVMLHPGSLGHLIDLSDTSWSTCVRSVVISIHRLSESGLQTSTRPNAYRQCLEKQRRFFHVGNAAQLLCTALSKLPNCRSLILEDKDEDDEDEDAVPWGFRRLSEKARAKPVCALRHIDSNPSLLKDHDSFLKFALDIIIEAAKVSKHIQKLDIRVGSSHEVDLHAMAPGDIMWSMKGAKSIQRRLTSLSLVVDPNRRRLGTPMLQPLESFLNSFQQLRRLRLQFFSPDPNFLFPKLSSSLKLSKLEVLELEGVSGVSREELVTLLDNHQTTLREVVITHFIFKEPGAVPYLQEFCDKRRVQVKWHDCGDYEELSFSPGHEWE